ncbi:MAG: hypothetical protein RLZZ31_624, partial [Actinomycetota bacterium]
CSKSPHAVVKHQYSVQESTGIISLTLFRGDLGVETAYAKKKSAIDVTTAVSLAITPFDEPHWEIRSQGRPQNEPHCRTNHYCFKRRQE